MSITPTVYLDASPNGLHPPNRPQSSVTERRWQLLPRAVREQGERLLDQEFWFFGRDIRRTDGNLLEAYGFCKHRAPLGVQGSHAYHHTFDHQRTLTLWGFGLSVWCPFYGRLYLPRFSFCPSFLRFGAELPPIWESRQLGDRDLPDQATDWQTIAELLVPTLHWIRDYEIWVSTTVGRSYRQDCFDARKRAVSTGPTLADTWERFSRDCERAINERIDLLRSRTFLGKDA